MVVLDSNTNNKSNSSSSSSPKALYLWRSFKKENPEDTQKLEKDENKPPNKPVNKKRHTNSDAFDNSSCSSRDSQVQRCRRAVMQEKLFRSQLQSRRQKQSHESSFSTDSSYNSSTDRQRKYLSSDDYYNNENDEHVNMTGVLHLKKPLSANSDNAKKYYEDRGRMEPINWKSVPSNGICQEKKPEMKKKPEMQKETIKTIAKSKPPVSDEFSNFVENSVSRKDAYNIQGNIERNVNALDSPIFKIQQLINKEPLQTIRIPAAVRTSFLKSSSGYHVFNKIDTFRVIDPMKNGDYRSIETARQDEACVSRQTAAQDGNVHSQYKDMPRENERSVNVVRSTSERNTESKVRNRDRKSFSSNAETRTNDHDNPENTNWSKQTNGFDDQIKYVPNGTYKKQSRKENGYFNEAEPVQNGHSQCKKEGERSYRSSKFAQIKSSDCKNEFKENGQFFNHTKRADQKFNFIKVEKEDTYNLAYNKFYDPEVKGREETKDHRPTHDCDDDDMVSYVNSLTYEENVAKKQSRKQGMDIEDDLFAFVPNPSESASETLNSPDPFARKISSHNYSFNRMKALCREKEKINKSLDSDDTLNISSDLESLSVSRASTRERFKAFRNKMFKTTSSCQHTSILPDENDDTKVLENRNQLLNRCLRASHDYLKEHENNVIEITNVKVGPKVEPLLKPISTRYFTKPSDTEKLCNNNNNNNNNNDKLEKAEPCISRTSETRLLNSTPIRNLQEEKEEKSNVDFCIKSNTSIDNISSIATSSVGRNDSKTDLKHESNDTIYVEFQKGNKIDSASCIKNIKNSLVTPDVSETKIDLKINNEKDCDASRHEKFTEPINISRNLESTIKSESQHSTRVLEITKEFDTKPKMIKNDSKIEVISFDSESDKMDCEEVDYDAFDVENIEMFFPSLPNQVENLKRVLSSGMTNDDRISSLNRYSNSSKIQSLESISESSNSNYSSANTSISSNFNSDSENPSSSYSLINFNEVFKKVDIKISELETSGLDYDDNSTKKIKYTNQKDSKDNNNIHLDLYPINSKENTLNQTPSDEKNLVKDANFQIDFCSMNSTIKSASQEKLCNQKGAEKENIEQNLNNNHDASSAQHSEKRKLNNDNTTVTSKPVSKKMQKYHSTLKNYKHKLKTETSSKEEDKHIQQSDNTSQNENLHLQEPVQQCSILKEIQKHKLHLNFKRFV